MGTLESLWDANMDMLARDAGLDLLEPDWPIYARTISLPPAFLGKEARVEHSAVSRGCDLEGTVLNSVLSPGVVVEKGAQVSYSVLMPGTVVKSGAVVQYAILGENCYIGENGRVGSDPAETDPDKWGLSVLGPGSKTEPGRVVPAKTMLDRYGKEVAR